MEIPLPQTLPSAPWARRTGLLIRILLAAAFLAAGTAKLAGVPMMVQVFDAVGIGQWFRLVTGAIEIVGAILVLLPATVAPGAAVLAATMVGAVLTHLLVIGGNPAPAIVLLLLSVSLLWLRRADLPRLTLSKYEVVA